MISGLVERPLEALIPNAQNARTHSEEQVRQIADSIREFGWTNPVLIDEDGGIIAGHGRVMAARLLERQDVPCLVITGLTAEQRRAYMLADNKLALNAGWNQELLANELFILKGAGFNLDLIGFSAQELKGLIGPEAAVRTGLTDDDAAPAVQPVAVSHPGDIWVLGRHRLMVGDATNLADVQRLMGDQKADMVWTDPPYNVAYEGSAGSIINDDQSAELFERFILRAMSSCEWSLKPGGCFYVAYPGEHRGPAFGVGVVKAGLKLAQVLIWVKNSAVMGRQDYNWQHEAILYGWKPGAAHYFAGDFTLTTVIDEPFDVAKLTAAQARKLAKELLEARASTVLREDRPTKNDLHPTMKPVALVQRNLEASSREEALVFDPFGGSGTTLITAEKTNRRAFVLELDPKYADVIIRRWQDFTGRQAKHANGATFDDTAKIPAYKTA